jgi:uncharacterized protein (DUF2267 family)
VTGDEARDLLAQLPGPLKDSVTVTEPATRLTADEFLERVASELDVSTDEARRRVQAVFTTIRDAVTPGEFHDVLVQLPSGFVELLQERAAV